jgi:phosphatidylglycerol:prolipoprotein diacylglycerol transferase
MAGVGYHGGGLAPRARACDLRRVHPILFRIGSYPVSSYGVALMIAFAVGIAIARRRAITAGIDEDRVIDACMIALVTSLVGARALWVATHPDLFRPPQGSWVDAVNPFRSGRIGLAGLSVLGGLGLATVSSLAYLRLRGMPVLRTADVLAPSVALGEGITRIGCFLNGCCYGLPCDLPWCLRFPEASGAGQTFPGVAVHPTQLYASALGFATFAALSALLSRKPFDGAVFFALLALGGLARAALEILRYSEASVIWLRVGATAVSSNQLISLAMAAIGVAGWMVCSRSAAARADGAPAR